jgi:hypothetical protein
MNFLGGYKYVVDFIVIALLVAGIAFGIHKYNSYQQDIGSERVQQQWDQQKLLDKTAADKLRDQFQKDKDDALAQSAANIKTANALAAAAVSSGRVLDSTLQAIRTSSASTAIDANRKYVTALTEVLGDCKDQYRQMGREAQGHADDSLMYQLSWPKVKGN